MSRNEMILYFLFKMRIFIRIIYWFLSWQIMYVSFRTEVAEL